MMNVILLDGDEDFIKWLNPEKLEIVENEEQYALSTLTITYPLSDTIRSDINDFKAGNKLWITGATGLRDCLYVINEVVDNDLWKENSISLTVEDVLVELNYTPLITMADIPTKSVTINSTHLNEWFGNWYNIGTVETGLTNNTISLNGSMTRMELLRLIEEETGNVFLTEYKTLDSDDESFNPYNPNMIQRTLHFVRPYNAGTAKNNIIDLSYNAENIIYSADESDSYRAIAPVMKYDENSETSRNDFITLINSFKNLEVVKGSQVPMILTEATTAKIHPLRNEGQYGTNYWRRTPGSESYHWFSDLLKYGGTVTAANSKTLMGSASATSTNKGKFFSCNADGTYYYWNGSSQVSLTCKAGDQWLSNGSSWGKYSNDTNWTAHSVKYVQAEALWEAPFTKHKGEFYVSDYDNDTKINYKAIFSRPDYDNPLDEVTVEADTSETPEDGTGTEEDTLTKHNTPKIGTVETSDLNEFLIYNDCCMTLKEKRYPTIDLEVDIKDLDPTNSYNIFDTVNVKIPTFDNLVNATVVKTEKNPHKLGDNSISLASSEVNGRVNLGTPHFEIKNLIEKENNSFTFSGKLLEQVAGETVIGGETVLTLEDMPVANKWVSIAVIKPDSTVTTHTKTIKQTVKTTNKTSYYDKYGRTPSKDLVCGIGLKSAGKDTGKYGTWYKGVFKNYCPHCKKSGGIYWGWNRTNTYNPITKKNWTYKKNGAKVEGEFSCGYCGADYSVQGHEKINGSNYKLTKHSLSTSSKTNATKLVNGKLVYSNKTTKTTNNPGSTKTSTATSSGWTKLYTAKTNSNGVFSLKMKLAGMEDKNYTIRCTFGGDSFYNTCTSDCTLTIPTKEVYKTVYEKSTSSGGGSSSKVTTQAIKRGSSNTNCTNLKRQSGVVSKTVINKAKEIVGTKKGTSAVKALANYVAKNIKYEYKNNFYQSPSKTLSRKKGNCCCKTDLFLQMMEACNLLHAQGGDFYVKYVHPSGHVLALVRHKDSSSGVYVDCTQNNPWGNYARSYNPHGAKTTSYPCLPFERGYK